MNTEEFIVTIFLEHLGSASLLPLLSSITLQAMELFGGYNLQLAALAGAGGLVAGSMLNWLFGIGITLLRQRVTVLGNNPFTKAKRFFNHYGFVLAAFFWLPLGSILLLVIGFFRVAWWKVLPMVVIGAIISLRAYLF